MRYKKELVYLCGPMTGIQDFNFPEFNRVAALLESKKVKAINPVAWGQANTEAAWEQVMKIAISEMLKCSRVVVLDGWQRSRGASIEVKLAKQLGMKVERQKDGKPISAVDIWISDFFGLLRAFNIR